MTWQLVGFAGLVAQIACFAMIARASFGFFRQGRSAVHAVTRLATLGASAGFAVLAVWAPAPGPWGLGALALTGLSVWLFHRATETAMAGVLHVAFADGPSARLVTEGIYARIRNPFYTSYLLYWTAWAVLLGLAWPGLAGLAFFTALYWWAVRREERALADQFGTAYAAYKARAGRFLPRTFGRA